LQIGTSDELNSLSLPGFGGAASIFQYRSKRNDKMPLCGLSARVVILIFVLLCSSFASSHNAIAQDTSSPNAAPRSELLLTCPPKSPQGASFIEMGISFSVERPTQDVTCLNSDGSRIAFVVEKECDVEPADIITTPLDRAAVVLRKAATNAGNQKSTSANVMSYAATRTPRDEN
jgi:hypothetical protein